MRELKPRRKYCALGKERHNSGLRRIIPTAGLKRYGSYRRHARLPNAKDRRQHTGGLAKQYSVYGG